MKVENYLSVEFPSRSANEALARSLVACFAAQLDPTMDELGDIKTAVSEAVTNCIVHAYPDRIGTITLRCRILEGRTLDIVIRDKGRGIPDIEQARTPMFTTGGEERHGLHDHGELYDEPARDVEGRQGDNGTYEAQDRPPGGRQLSTQTLIRAAQAGDRSAAEQLVVENSGLIWSIARRYFGRGTEPDDLYQLGCVGFLKAVAGFDLSYGTQFSTYAVPKIAGEIRRFLRDDG